MLRWLPIIMLTTVCVQSSCIGQETGGSTLAVEELSRQFKIYRDAIYLGPGESMRVDAATELLMDNDATARRILLDALRQMDNTGARNAVYRALIDSRRWRWSTQVQNIEDFVEPLVSNLRKREREEALLIAEALRLFEYRQIGKELSKILDDPEASGRSRLNVVDVLRIRPESEAISELIRLLDGKDEAVAAAATEALQEWIPLGSDRHVWRGILEELKRKSRTDIVRERLQVLEMQKRDLSERVKTWQGMYISSLSRIYGTLPEPLARQAFVLEQLQSEQSVVRLWGVERVREMGLSESQLPMDLANRIISLIGDSDPGVRLAVAKMLSLRSNIDSAARLLAQLRVETEEAVKLELMGALGSACYFAFLPGSQISLSMEIRNATLELAAEFLRDSNAARALKGAEVLGQLLEQNGLSQDAVVGYLNMLKSRYAGATTEPRDGQFRAELLKLMSRLCEQGVNKAEAANLFRGVFEAGVRDERMVIREASLAGLAAIDRPAALAVVRAQQLHEDPSEAVRLTALRLASGIGSERDLEWCMLRLDAGGNGEAAWGAIRKILERADVDAQLRWVQTLDERGLAGKVVFSEWAGLLLAMEQKALADGDTKAVLKIRLRLAEGYRSRGDFERSAIYYRLLHGQLVGKDKDDRAGDMVDMCLRAMTPESMKMLGEFLTQRLERSDIREGEPFVRRIDEFFAARPAGASEVLGVLGAVRRPGATNWERRYEIWVAGMGM